MENKFHIVSQEERNRWLIIENIKTWVLPKIPNLHPDSVKHTQLWREYSKRCIEGFWGLDFGKYRFMPPKLYYYINFFTIVHEEDGKPAVKMRPMLRDLEWEVFYMFFVAKGFSGFTDDDEYSCNSKIIDYNKGNIKIELLHKSCINNQGKVKQYLDPLTYARMLHDYPKGKPLYLNTPKNVMLFGSRSSGKTYGISGIHLHEIIFAGETSYDEYLSKKQKDSLEEAGLCIGAANSGKSAQFFKYMEEAMRQYSINSDLGVWGKLGQDDDYEPCPFYREMVGETKPNNAKSPWRDEYKVKHNGKEVIKGSRSFAKHVNYKDDSEAAASGRYNYNTIEEIGLLEDAPTAWVSNEFTVSRGIKKVASLVGLGTSGVIEKVEGAKQIFLNPFTYDCVPYKDYLEHNGQQGYTGFFIPAYMINMDFKDENGNTDIQAAKKYAWDKLETLKDNPVQYRAYCMHNPLLISHMWINSKGDMLPVEEASLREKELMVKNKYKELMLPVKLIWNSATQSGVEYRPDETLKPIINPYTEGQDSDAEGCVVIYQKPEYNKYGKIYPDQYFYLHDPYVSNITGDSLGVVYVISNPKYIPEGLSGNEIVASYIGKNPRGKDAYTEEMEKLIQLYGNCPGMLWYEANRGEDVRNYFNNRNKQALLCVRPQLAKGTKGNMINVRDNGYMVGNLVAKISMIDNFADWLKQKSNSEEGKLNIEVIPCLYLLRQIQMYNTDDNFDGVSAMLGYPLALKEFTSFQRTETIKKSNPHSFLINNDFIGRVR